MYETQAEESGRRRGPLKSFFTRRLEVKVQERGIDLPPEFISILDVPFQTFTEEQETFYQVEFKPFTYFFIEILIDLYEALGAHREGWEEMMGRLPDCPVKELVRLALREKARLEGFDEGVEEEPAFDPLEFSKPVTLTAEKKVVKTYRPGEAASKKSRWWEKKVF